MGFENEKTFVGLDPGIRNTGWAILTAGGVYRCGVFTTDPNENLETRILSIVDQTKQRFWESYNIRAVCIEKQLLFVSGPGRSNVERSIKVEGALIAVFSSSEIHLVTPAEWQNSFVSGKKGKKKRIREKLERYAGRELCSHEADALGLALFARRKYDGS